MDTRIHGDPRRVQEVLEPGIPALVHEGWRKRFPWLVQGTTTRGSGPVAYDLGLFSDASEDRVVREHWSRLLEATGMTRAAHAHQVHGAEVRAHGFLPEGLALVESCDGHVTTREGTLLAVTVADCVPVFAIAPEVKAVAVVHAGWRGTAAGVLERGLAALSQRPGAAASVHLHLGPSICGDCYEVGPEVFAALSRPVPEGPAPIDLREVLVDRAVVAGVSPSHISVSEHCTLCTRSGLFSHRGGDGERQVGYIGIRA
jgi:YfiH family protein